ncbi:hypothetical protein E4P42_08820 [Mycobacterium sp. PS03-16]|uniref:hypothetical protein n=1 Tax=Mycobacterium sp. PS03-16 TaxID=2559611 RepID=UPI0010732846|nr:hypothetical protein [Mycobacterium sp. PS03-16]TFV59494.1 hypothetical protein E4P42_08820 [Mycobacterium sp. PS03-16]
MAEVVTGEDGASFLERTCSYEWPEDGAEPAGLFTWIRPAVDGADQPSAQAAGKIAHSVAEFFAEHPDATRDCEGRNPALFESLAAALISYQGAMVGDPAGTTGFAPLDAPDSDMPRTASLFSTMNSAGPAGQGFVAEARQRVDRYEEAFADQAAADPAAPITGSVRGETKFAGRLLGLIARVEQDGEGGRVSLSGPKSQLEYAVVSRMVRGSDPRISAQFFDPQGTLISPGRVDNAQSSLYAAQLSNFLSAYPAVSAAIADFNDNYQRIANA